MKAARACFFKRLLSNDAMTSNTTFNLATHARLVNVRVASACRRAWGVGMMLRKGLMGLAFLGMTSSAWAQGAFIDETLKSRMQAGEKAARVIIVTKEVDAAAAAGKSARRGIDIGAVNKILRGEAPIVRPLGGATYGATVTAKGLDALAKSKDVVAVVEDIEYQRAMFDTHPLVRVDAARQGGLTGKGTVVVVIDDGFDTSHPFIKDAVVGEACFGVNDEAAGLVSLCRERKIRDVGVGSAAACAKTNWDCEHGTHVAGIVGGRGAKTPKGEIFEGVATGAGLYLIKAFSHTPSKNDCGDPRGCGTFSASVLQTALEHVIEISKTMNIVAVNMSLGGGLFSMNCEYTDQKTQHYLPALKALTEKDIAIVVASGNNSNIWGISHPACLSDAFAVGSIDRDGLPSKFSNTGIKVDVLAPGGDIYSSVPGGGYDSMRGTSMAAPYVSGIIALVREKVPREVVPIRTVYDAIRRTGRVVRDNRNDLFFPVVQADRAVEAIVFSVKGELAAKLPTGSGQQPAATPVAAPVVPPRPVAPAAEPGLAGAPQPVQPAAVPQPQRPAAAPAPSGGGINDILRQTAPKANPFQ